MSLVVGADLAICVVIRASLQNLLSLQSLENMIVDVMPKSFEHFVAGFDAVLDHFRRRQADSDCE